MTHNEWMSSYFHSLNYTLAACACKLPIPDSHPCQPVCTPPPFYYLLTHPHTRTHTQAHTLTHSLENKFSPAHWENRCCGSVTKSQRLCTSLSSDASPRCLPSAGPHFRLWTGKLCRERPHAFFIPALFRTAEKLSTSVAWVSLFWKE